jgi:hypothetical protein
MCISCELKRRFGQLMLAISLMLATSLATMGYTVILRDGRKVDIGSDFTVTKTTVTYAKGHNIFVTLQMAAIDVAATERANNESPGALMRRADNAAVRNSGAPLGISGSGVRRSITNTELEQFASVRRTSDAAYDRRQKELGLPSLDESRRQAAAADEALARTLADRRTAELEARVDHLTNQIAAGQAQMSTVQTSGFGFPNDFFWGSSEFPFVPFNNFGTFGAFGNGFFNPFFNPFFHFHRRIFVAPHPTTGGGMGGGMGRGGRGMGGRR